MENIKIIIEYDGTNYCGWQRQKNTDQTIQQQLEKGLTLLNKSPVTVYGAGRTDSGAHAKAQAANFYLDVSIPEARIPDALNSVLPEDIICKYAEKVALDFHARYDSQGKKYRYRILNRSFSSVFVRNFVYNIRQNLDFGKVLSILKDLEGTHNFSSFEAQGSARDHSIRTIEEIEFYDKSPEYWIEIKGDGFLYKMVRIIVGTLIEIGLNKRKANLKEILQKKDRSVAGFTAPAQGLTLLKVYY